MLDRDPSTPARDPQAVPAEPLVRPRRLLLRKYIATFVAVVGIPLAGYTVVGVWFAAEEHRDAPVEVQRANAEAAAWRISQFAREIEGQLRWATHLSWKRRLGVPRFEHGRTAAQTQEHPAQGFADEGVVVDYEELRGEAGRWRRRFKSVQSSALTWAANCSKSARESLVNANTMSQSMTS